MSEPEVLDVVELATRVKMNPNSLRRLCAQGRVPHMKIGGSIRFVWPTILNELERR